MSAVNVAARINSETVRFSGDQVLYAGAVIVNATPLQKQPLRLIPKGLGVDNDTFRVEEDCLDDWPIHFRET